MKKKGNKILKDDSLIGSLVTKTKHQSRQNKLKTTLKDFLFVSNNHLHLKLKFPQLQNNSVKKTIKLNH